MPWDIEDRSITPQSRSIDHTGEGWQFPEPFPSQVGLGNVERTIGFDKRLTPAIPFFPLGRGCHAFDKMVTLHLHKPRSLDFLAVGHRDFRCRRAHDHRTALI